MRISRIVGTESRYSISNQRSTFPRNEISPLSGYRWYNLSGRSDKCAFSIHSHLAMMITYVGLLRRCECRVLGINSGSIQTLSLRPSSPNRGRAASPSSGAFGFPPPSPCGLYCLGTLMPCEWLSLSVQPDLWLHFVRQPERPPDDDDGRLISLPLPPPLSALPFRHPNLGKPPKPKAPKTTLSRGATC